MKAFIKKINWKIIIGICVVLFIYLLAALILSYLIFSEIAAQIHQTASIFDEWWQVMLFILCIVLFILMVISTIMAILTRNDREKEKTIIFRRYAWTFATVFFVILTIISFIGGIYVDKYSAQLNDVFDVDPYRIENVEGSTDTEYYKTLFYKSDGTYDNNKMRQYSLAIARQAAIESSILLWNNDQALPLKKDNKISLFGQSSANYYFCGTGSGQLNVVLKKNLKQVLEDRGFTVNGNLFDAYKSLPTRGLGDFSGVRKEDINYTDFTCNEPNWDKLNDSKVKNAANSVTQYNDAAVMIVTRMSGETADTNFKLPTAECIDNNYMDLTFSEVDILTHLQKLKQENKIKKIIMLINSGNAMQFKNIKKYDIDACVWVGIGGNESFDQIADVLSGDGNPSGHLTDTYLYDNDSSACIPNFGDFTFTKSNGVPQKASYTQNNKYVVYQEGIYVGYRYYETRYEDCVLGGRQADSTTGVKAGSGNWNYDDEVAFPFGYGLSYTTFDYSNYSVSSSDDEYVCKVTVTNTGSVAGKDAVQIYMQRPYTEYDIQYGIEKPAVELVGYEKTKKLNPGEKQTVTVKVPKESFKTYDSYNKKTYILEKGDYYLATGTDAHDALNNILSLKGKSVENGMDNKGDKSFAYKIEVKHDDFKVYSVSNFTNEVITNQFDHADVNLYEGTRDQKITYLSRNKWSDTFPTGVTLTCESEKMIADMQYASSEDIQSDKNDMPVYSKNSNLSLIMLSELDYDDEKWDLLLDQMTFEEQETLILKAYHSLSGAVSVGAVGGTVHDGPGGINAGLKGMFSQMAFPVEVNLASTFNRRLVEEAGYAFGMEMMHANVLGVYGPGSGIHRSAGYSGRNFEYWSEDGFISGGMLSSYTKGLRKTGTIVFAKHFLLNDQERNRYGVATFANEQSIREIYLKAFEQGITDGYVNGVMSSFNRIGCTWSGRDKNMLTNVLRNEMGFTGMVITDAGVGAHMLGEKTVAEAVMAGNDLWLGGDTSLQQYKTNSQVCNAMRESAHRILYNQLFSRSMNGISANTKILKITPPYVKVLNVEQVVVASVTALCVVMCACSYGIYFNRKLKYGKKETK